MFKLFTGIVTALSLFFTSRAWADPKAGVLMEPDSITLVGTFHGVFGPVLTSDPARGGMGTVTCNGRSYVLHFSGSLATDELSKLGGKKVVVIGQPDRGPLGEIPREEGGREGFVVLVSRMPKVADEKAEEKATLTVRAKLDYEELESKPVQQVWSVTIHGETFRLRFLSKELREKAVSLSGELVRVTGTIDKDGKLMVTQLLPAGR
jgi:hypothetical protein